MAQLLAYTKFQKAFPGSAFVTDLPVELAFVSDTIRPSPASTVSVDRPSHDQPPADPLPQGSARAEDSLTSAIVGIEPVPRRPERAADPFGGLHAPQGKAFPLEPQSSRVVDRDGDLFPRALEGASAPSTIAVIGGTKFDATALETWVKSLPKDIVVVTGDGRGAEKELRALLRDRGIRVDVPGPVDISRPLESRSALLAVIDQAIAHGKGTLEKNQLSLQVESILAVTQPSRAPVVLLGEGSRVDTARRWLKRGKWGREASEPLVRKGTDKA